MGASEIILDPKIRDWVLIPLTIIMVFMGLGRHYAAKLMRKVRAAASGARGGGEGGAGHGMPRTTAIGWEARERG